MLKSLPRRSWFLIRVHHEAARQAAEGCKTARGNERGNERERGCGPKGSVSTNNLETEIAQNTGFVSF